VRGKTSNNLCEAWVKRRVRDTSQLPRRLAYLWLDMVTPRLCKGESVFEASIFATISKRRYGMETEGNPIGHCDRMKSKFVRCECLWLPGYKPSTSVGGVRSEKMRDQIHKDSYPELGCSGDLNPTVTVHLVNVGTSCLGGNTGPAAVDVRHGGRESLSI